MNEEIKDEPIEDEENLRTTPERQSILDYKKSNSKPDEAPIDTESKTDNDENNVVVKAEPQEELRENNEVLKDTSNETLVAGTTVEQEQTRIKLENVESTKQSIIDIPSACENVDRPIQKDTNPSESTRLNAENEQDKSENTTPLENVSVKTETGITSNDTIDMDMTIARPADYQSIGQSVETSLEVVQSAEIINEAGIKDVNVNEPMDLEDTAAVTASTLDTETPPPPTISTSRITDPIDGRATPRITLAPMSRLRVKTEFSLIPTPQSNEETSALPQDFFEDLLNVDKRSESGEISSNSDSRSQDEPIPDNFFDDLLRDKFKERIEEAQNCELEEKYSDRLKELKRLREKSRERKKSHKKQKKSKKRSRKRSRSRSPPQSLRENQRDRYNRTPSPEHLNNKRSRKTLTPQQLPSTSSYGNLNKVSKDAGGSSIFVNHDFQIKSEFHTFEPSNAISFNRYSNADVELLPNLVKVELPVVNCEDVTEVEEILTPKQKKERAIKRATTLVSHLTNMSSDTKAILSTFQYTSIVRKLPASHSYVNQQIYENRSPLHTVNNVNYKFNSHATRFNMEEWGLATLPTHAAKIAKLIGCDALTIHNKLKTFKIPAKLQKNKTDSTEQGEEVIETTSSFFCNVMTQTDDVEELEQLKTKGYEIGVQVEPNVCEIGSQTLETQSPTKNQSNHDELPIMKVMHDLNENQLMAIHDFAELIKEPAGNAMDMYVLRMRMLEIYKCSQLPSASATAPTQVINNYTTSRSRNSPPRHRRPAQVQQPIIQSVSSADGTHFSINDPRAKSAAYTSRGAAVGSNSVKDSSSNYDPRFSAFTQPPSSSSSESRYLNTSPSSRQRSSSSSQQSVASSTGKYYGRGGLRR